jgi:hypothetical protein
MAAQEKRVVGAGRNRKNLHLTDITALANSTNSSLMQTHYPAKNQFESQLLNL